MAHSCSRGGDPRQTEGTLREIQVNLLECKVCFEKFNAQKAQRRPQNLSCGHVLCVECVRALSHPLLKKLECPFCRQLCPIDATSQCRVLCDLQELLLFSPAASCLEKQVEESASAGRGKNFHLCLTFGGWGTLINPTGLAVMPFSGTVFVVHDGEKRVVVFTPQGKELNTFGQRGHASEEVCYPVDVAVTHCGHVVVTDAGDKAIKVFTSRGTHVISVKAGFSLPWGVDTDSAGHILVSDVNAGTLSRIKVDYRQGVTLEERTVVSHLERPKTVACCRANGQTAVMEHVHSPREQSFSRLTVFTPDFHVLYQTDTLSVNLKASVKIVMSSVTFDKNGQLIVLDSLQGMIWSFGNGHCAPVLTPLVAEHLIRPVGLVMVNNTLMVVDGGDHTVKMYS